MNPNINFRMPPRLLEQFEQKLATVGLTRTEALNRLIEAWVKGLIPMPTRELTIPPDKEGEPQ